MSPRAFVAMSGGVDSSVAAALLQEAGHDVVGVSMHLWCEDKRGSGARQRPCCSREDVHDAQEVCRILDIPHYVINLEEEFLERVVAYFVKEYSLGRTPNPCLACNEHMKFDLLLNRVLALGGDYLATGHYAGIRTGHGGLELVKSIDPTKDQSYVLYTLGQKDLGHLLFPVGGYTKARVREMAAERKLPVADKADSQEICFVPEAQYSSFVAARSTCLPGDMVDMRGRVLGRHRGLAYYTIGQRRGLGISSPTPLFVQRIDAAANTVVVAGDGALYGSALVAGRLSWVSGQEPSTPLDITAKIRYKAPAAEAALFLEGNNARVEFRQPQRAITPGQAVVFYDGEVVLGGGIIETPA